MNCPKCGTQVVGGAAFCQACGAKLTKDATGVEPVAQLAQRGRDVPEQTIWEGSFSPKAMLGWWAIAGGGSVVLLIVAAIFAPAPLILAAAGGLCLLVFLTIAAIQLKNRLRYHYKLTNQRLVCEIGILNRNTDRTDLISINDINCSQSLIDRFVGTGTIVLATSEPTSPIRLRGIADAQKIAAQIDQARRAEYMRRSVIKSIGGGGDIDASHHQGE